MLLVMTLVLGVDQRTAQGINLLFFLPTAASALWCHAQTGCLDKLVLRRTIPPALAAALLGAWFSSAADPELLRRPFGIYLLISAAMMLYPKKNKKRPE